MRLLYKASEEKKDFYDLIGSEVTFRADIISEAGTIMHTKGEKAFISDVEYIARYYSTTFLMTIEPEILTFRINDIKAQCWNPVTFMEFKTKTHEI